MTLEIAIYILLIIGGIAAIILSVVYFGVEAGE